MTQDKYLEKQREKPSQSSSCGPYVAPGFLSCQIVLAKSLQSLALRFIDLPIGDQLRQAPKAKMIRPGATN